MEPMDKDDHGIWNILHTAKWSPRKSQGDPMSPLLLVLASGLL
jgi:hypothetical protein